MLWREICKHDNGKFNSLSSDYNIFTLALDKNVLWMLMSHKI